MRPRRAADRTGRTRPALGRTLGAEADPAGPRPPGGVRRSTTGGTRAARASGADVPVRLGPRADERTRFRRAHGPAAKATTPDPATTADTRRTPRRRPRPPAPPCSRVPGWPGF